jgi:UDP-N-acetylmuramoyl-L-alanyl-D-glutamate--2,6-diaminopimelate ligase
MTSGLKRTINYGCGLWGNRDKTKRPIMASIASELSDKVVLTLITHEDPDIIIKEMEEGVAAEN